MVASKNLLWNVAVLLKFWGSGLEGVKVSTVPCIYLCLVTSPLPTQSDFPGGLCPWEGVTGCTVSVWAPFSTPAPVTQTVAVSTCTVVLCLLVGWEGVPWALARHGGEISSSEAQKLKLDSDHNHHSLADVSAPTESEFMCLHLGGWRCLCSFWSLCSGSSWWGPRVQAEHYLVVERISWSIITNKYTCM